MRLVIARCSVDYVGRLTAHLPMATRVLMIKADGSGKHYPIWNTEYGYQTSPPKPSYDPNGHAHFAFF